ncbi:hypothetical protein H4R24_004714 [Coemansia sp. RSA 988]|nr:hypothetical protein H4R24_004714 [Coemansia sp. RSA 988]
MVCGALIPIVPDGDQPSTAATRITVTNVDADLSRFVLQMLVKERVSELTGIIEESAVIHPTVVAADNEVGLFWSDTPCAK